MTSRQQGWYWMGLGVLALGLTNNPATDPSRWVHEISDQAEYVTAAATDEVVAYVDCAKSTWDDKVRVADAHEAATLAHAQARMAHANARWAREQAKFARMQAAQMRMVQVRLPEIRIPEIHVPAVKVICPQQQIVVDVPQIDVTTD